MLRNLGIMDACLLHPYTTAGLGTHTLLHTEQIHIHVRIASLFPNLGPTKIHYTYCCFEIQTLYNI
jgi:hypothetical protein